MPCARRARAERVNLRQVHGRKSYLAATDVQMKIVDVGVGGQAREERPAETKQPSKADNGGGQPKDFCFFISDC